MATPTALLVVDVQNDFMPGGSMEVPTGDEVIAAINKVRRSCRDTLAAVVTTQDYHPPGHVSFASSHPGLRPGMNELKLVYFPEGRLLAYRYPDVLQPVQPARHVPCSKAQPPSSGESSPHSPGMIKLSMGLWPGDETPAPPAEQLSPMSSSPAAPTAQQHSNGIDPQDEARLGQAAAGGVRQARRMLLEIDEKEKQQQQSQQQMTQRQLMSQQTRRQMQLQNRLQDQLQELDQDLQDIKSMDEGDLPAEAPAGPETDGHSTALASPASLMSVDGSTPASGCSSNMMWRAGAESPGQEPALRSGKGDSADSAPAAESAAVEELCLLAPVLGQHPHHRSHSHITTENVFLSQRLWPDHCVAGTQGADVASSLMVLPNDIIVRKGVECDIDNYSAFFDNGRFRDLGLHEQLQALGVRRLLLTGLCTELCVLWTVRDALQLGYQVWVLRDAVRGMDEKAATAALEEMSRLGAKVVDSEDVITEQARTGATL